MQTEVENTGIPSLPGQSASTAEPLSPGRGISGRLEGSRAMEALFTKGYVLLWTVALGLALFLPVRHLIWVI